MVTGSTLYETHQLLTDLGATVIGFGVIVKFNSAPKEIEGIEIKSLVDFDSPIYDTVDEWKSAEGNDSPEEKVIEF